MHSPDPHRPFARTATLLACTGIVAGAAAMAQGQGEKTPKFDAPRVIPSHSGTSWAGRPYGIAAADFLDSTGAPGQDGLPEIVVVNSGADLLACEPAAWGQISVFMNTGEWGVGETGLELVQEISILPGLGAEIAIADLDGENGPDLIVTATQWVAGWQDSGVYVALNDGAGGFLPAAKHTMPLGVKGLVVGDVIGDGIADDVVVATTDCPQPDDGPLDFLWVKVGNGQGRFSNQIPVHLNIAGDLAPSDVVLADFVENSMTPYPDLIAVNRGKENYWVVENGGNGVLETRSVRRPGNCEGQWAMEAIAAARLNADGHADFAGVAGLDVIVFLGDGLGGFTSACEDPRLRCRLVSDDEAPPEFAHGIAIGQINGGGGNDIAVALRNLAVGRPEVAILLGRGDGTFQTPSSAHAYLFSLDGDPDDPGDVVSPLMLVIADLDDDGFGDVVSANHHSDTLSILLSSASAIPGP